MISNYPDATMRYGATDRQVADVFEPDEPVGSLILLLHGGLWRDSERTRTWPVARALARAGHLTTTVEYRRSPGQWADAFDDLITAIDQIQLSGREWTINNAAPSRVTLVGHSCGGQLALWAASRASLPLASRWQTSRLQITGAVALAPALNLAAMCEQGIGDGAVAEFFGGLPDDVPEVYAQADPAQLRPGVSVRVLHGRDDQVIPSAFSEAYATALAATADGDHRVEVLDGVDHQAWGVPREMAWQALDRAVRELTASQSYSR